MRDNKGQLEEEILRNIWEMTECFTVTPRGSQKVFYLDIKRKVWSKKILKEDNHFTQREKIAQDSNIDSVYSLSQ